jgi:WD40 repeat protein
VTSSRGAGDFAASLDGSVIVRVDLPASTLWRRDRPGAPVALSPHRDVRHVEVSPDGRWVTTRRDDTDHVKVWDAGTGRLAREFSEVIGPPCFSPDGRWLAAYKGRLRFWEVGTWRPITPGAQDTAEGIRSVTFSPDGRLVALAGNDVRLLDPSTGHGVAQLEGPARYQYRSLAFSPDGTMLAGAADYQAIHVWDLRAVRRELAAIGLDWDLPPYPPASTTDLGPLKIEIDPGPSGVTGAEGDMLIR